MKTAEVITKHTYYRQYQEHLEWDDENEACEADLASMGKCMISLGVMIILTIGFSIYFLVG